MLPIGVLTGSPSDKFGTAKLSSGAALTSLGQIRYQDIYETLLRVIWLKAGPTVISRPRQSAVMIVVALKRAFKIIMKYIYFLYIFPIVPTIYYYL